MQALENLTEKHEIMDLQEELQVPLTGILDDTTITVLDLKIRETGFDKSEHIRRLLQSCQTTDIQEQIREEAIIQILKYKYECEEKKINKFFKDLMLEHGEQKIKVLKVDLNDHDIYQVGGKFQQGSQLSSQKTTNQPTSTTTTVGELKKYAQTKFAGDKAMMRKLSKDKLFDGLSDDTPVEIFNDMTFEVKSPSGQIGIKQGEGKLSLSNWIGKGNVNTSKLIGNYTVDNQDKFETTEDKSNVVETLKNGIFHEVEGKLIEFDNAGNSLNGQYKYANGKFYKKNENGDFVSIVEQNTKTDETVVKPTITIKGNRQPTELQKQLLANIDSNPEFKKLVETKYPNYRPNLSDGIEGNKTKDIANMWKEFSNKPVGIDAKSEPTPSRNEMLLGRNSDSTPDKTTPSITEQQAFIDNLLLTGNAYQQGGTFKSSSEQLAQIRKVKETEGYEAAYKLAMKFKDEETNTSIVKDTNSANSQFDNSIWDNSENATLTSAVLDLISIADPEPFSAVGIAAAAQALDERARYLERERKGESYSLGDAGYSVLSTLGTIASAVPILGDAGLATRVASKLPVLAKLAKNKKLLKTAVTGLAVGVAGSQIEGMVESISQLINDWEQSENKSEFLTKPHTLQTLGNVVQLLKISPKFNKGKLSSPTTTTKPAPKTVTTTSTTDKIKEKFKDASNNISAFYNRLKGTPSTTYSQTSGTSMKPSKSMKYGGKFQNGTVLEKKKPVLLPEQEIKSELNLIPSVSNQSNQVNISNEGIGNPQNLFSKQKQQNPFSKQKQLNEDLTTLPKTWDTAALTNYLMGIASTQSAKGLVKPSFQYNRITPTTSLMGEQLPINVTQQSTANPIIDAIMRTQMTTNRDAIQSQHNRDAANQITFEQNRVNAEMNVEAQRKNKYDNDMIDIDNQSKLAEQAVKNQRNVAAIGTAYQMLQPTEENKQMVDQYLSYKLQGEIENKIEKEYPQIMSDYRQVSEQIESAMVEYQSALRNGDEAKGKQVANQVNELRLKQQQLKEQYDKLYKQNEAELYAQYQNKKYKALGVPHSQIRLKKGGSIEDKVNIETYKFQLKKLLENSKQISKKYELANKQAMEYAKILQQANDKNVDWIRKIIANL